MPVLHIDDPPETERGDWELQVDGLVEAPHTYAYQELLDLEPIEYEGPFVCVTGWDREKIRWKGVHLSIIFKDVVPRDEADHVVFHAPSGYTDSLTLDQALDDRVLLAYEIEGRRLPREHGGPLRLVVPFLLAYKSVKWVNHVELIQGDYLGYWEERGYPVDAEVPEYTRRKVGLED